MITLQILFLFAAVCATVLGAPRPNAKALEDAKNHCIKELKIKTQKNGAVDKLDPNYKCFNFCYGNKMGFIDAQANVISNPLESNTTEAIAKCVKTNVETEKCAKANYMRECVKGHLVKKLEQHLEQYSEQCSKETKTKVADYVTMKTQALVNINNATFNCYHRCVFIKMQIIDEANNFKVTHIDNMVKEVGVSGVDNIIKICTEKNKQVDKCEQAVKRNICVGAYGVMKYSFSSQSLKNDADLIY